jgi:hypothetical protein
MCDIHQLFEQQEVRWIDAHSRPNHHTIEGLGLEQFSDYVHGGLTQVDVADLGIVAEGVQVRLVSGDSSQHLFGG